MDSYVSKQKSPLSTSNAFLQFGVSVVFMCYATAIEPFERIKGSFHFFYLG